MPFTTEDFLEALDLPQEHPYVIGKSSQKEFIQPWSIADYFGSVTSKKPSPNKGRQTRECEFSSVHWGNTDCQSTGNLGLGDYNNKALNADKISFLEEIEPCLASICHMFLLLFGPIIIALCIKRLTSPHRHKHFSPSNVMASGTSKYSMKLNRNATNCMIDLSTRKQSTSHNACCSSSTHQTMMTNHNQNNAIDPNTTAMRFFANLLAVFTPISTESQKIYVHQPSDKFTEDFNSCTGVGDPLAYIIALLVSSIIMTDAMYILEFSQSVLVALHILIISIGMKRLGSKTALIIALPITYASFVMMQRQDLDLPTIKPGLYYSKKNVTISNAVENFWPEESYTYEGKGTAWMMTGDTRTGLPFLLYSPPDVHYIRRSV